MGWAVPAALGVALARPGARVACVTGDGGVGYHLMELETALRCGIDVTIVVLNNVSMAFETHGQKLQWDNRVLPKVNDFLDVDYAAVARSLGARGLRVDQVGELKPALQDALTAGTPALVDVRIDKDRRSRRSRTSRRSWIERCDPRRATLAATSSRKKKKKSHGATSTAPAATQRSDALRVVAELAEDVHAVCWPSVGGGTRPSSSPVENTSGLRTLV